MLQSPFHSDSDTLLITGATGFLGSALVAELKSQNRRLICLVRGDNAESRTRALIPELGPEDAVIQGSVTDTPQLLASRLSSFTGFIRGIVHCAGRVRFDDNPSSKVYETNVEGTRNLLQMAALLDIPEFHLVSTAYVAGDRMHFSEKDRDCGQRLRNDYESSKLQAERLVSSWQGGRFTVYRPSILVGGEGAGTLPTRYGFYGVRRVFDMLRRKVSRGTLVDPDFIRAGIYIDDDNRLHLPLQVNCSRTSSLNLVPVDWAARMMARLITFPASGSTYHLVHPSPPKARWVYETSLSILEVKGMVVEDETFPVSGLRRRLQHYLDRRLKMYDPYLNQTEARLCDGETIRMLGNFYQVPPEVDEKFLTRLLEMPKPAPFVS